MRKLAILALLFTLGCQRQQVGRFQMIAVGEGAYRLDTVTGEMLYFRGRNTFTVYSLEETAEWVRQYEEDERRVEEESRREREQ